MSSFFRRLEPRWESTLTPFMVFSVPKVDVWYSALEAKFLLAITSDLVDFIAKGFINFSSWLLLLKESGSYKFLLWGYLTVPILTLLSLVSSPYFIYKMPSFSWSCSGWRRLQYQSILSLPLTFDLFFSTACSMTDRNCLWLMHDSDLSNKWILSDKLLSYYF